MSSASSCSSYDPDVLQLNIIFSSPRCDFVWSAWEKTDLHKILKFQSISYILLLLHHLYKYI